MLHQWRGALIGDLACLQMRQNPVSSKVEDHHFSTFAESGSFKPMHGAAAGVPHPPRVSLRARGRGVFWCSPWVLTLSMGTRPQIQGQEGRTQRYVSGAPLPPNSNSAPCVGAQVP
jgi:hypothetical protein